jgi:hypothetical protein
MKQNPCPIVSEVAKPTGIGLDELDGTVEAFCTGVTDSVLAEVEQSFLVTSEHLDDLFDRLQLAARFDRVRASGVESPAPCRKWGKPICLVKRKRPNNNLETTHEY